MGKNVIQDILSDDVHALETSRLNESEVERDFMSFFEPDRKERIVTRKPSRGNEECNYLQS